ncbi:MAG: MarR family transcriptional regulator [Novosphingobium sp. 12-64-8]|nr:MAG: MarR family transcriptional regulator [Novosphingobium sp. 12-64-8]
MNAITTMPSAVSVLAWDRLLRAGEAALETARAELKHAGLPAPEWYDVLVAIERHGPLRPRDLQARLPIAQYHLSRLLDRMVREGLVRRVPTPEDARGHTVELSPQGKAARALMWPAYATAIESVIGARLCESERIALANLLARLA